MPLIVLEGPEGAGKTTQVARLADRLRAKGRDVLSLREPGGTPLGEEVRRLLLDPVSDVSARAEALLYMASRAHLVERVIRPTLGRGATVLLDRFFLSTYAYQVGGRGLPESLVVAANQLAVGDVRPDLTILLALPASAGLARATKRGPHDRIEQADTEFHERVSRAFTAFASPVWQSAHPEAGPVAVVDASGSVADVEARVSEALYARLPALA